MPSIRELEAFYWVARLGTIQAAADKLHVTQPAITKRLKSIETLSHTPLFSRSRKTHLTPKGQELLEHCSMLMDSLQKLDKMQQSNDHTIRTIFIGTVELIALTWMTDLVRQIHSLYPDVRVQVIVDLTSNLQEMLLTRRIDLAIIPDLFPSGDLRRIPLPPVKFGWCCPPGAFPKNTITPLHELARLPLIDQGQGSIVTAMGMQLFSQAGIEPRRISGGNNLVVLAALVEAGFGICYLPLDLFSAELRKGTLQLVRTDYPQPPIQYFISFLHESEDTLNSAIAELARQCCVFSRKTRRILK